MSKFIIGMSSIVVIVLIVGALINMESWSKKNNHPRLIDLIKGKRNKK